jgi:DNA repair photolyase
MARPIRWKVVDDPEPTGQGALFDDVVAREFGRGEFRGLEFQHVHARRIVNDLGAKSGFGFRYTINAYRGCSHACTYCFARPTHVWLGLDAGRDFETVIVVKVNAVERLRAELAPGRWRGDPIAMGTNTDPYQRAEGKFRLTRGIVEVLTEAENPFSILTKSTLALRDLDVLAEAARRVPVTVNLSVGTLDADVWRTSEPGTPHPRLRLEAVARLNEAGVPSGVLIGPVLPGLSDDPAQVREVVRGAVAAGARTITSVLLHLRPGVREEFLPWLARTRPDRIPSYQRLYGRSSYAPTALQDRLTAMVRTFEAEARREQRTARPLAGRASGRP